MKIGEIDYNLKLPKKSLFLCKPNKQTIAKINEAFDIQYLTKISTVNEIVFKIPTIILVDDVPITNPNIERIKQRYIFKYVIGNKIEYFLFNESNKVYGESEHIEYRAYSLGVQLADKNVRNFEHIGNLQETSNELLDDVYGTNFYSDIARWTVGYVDSYFTSSGSSKRKYTVSSMSALEAIYDMAIKWNAVIRWDTEKLEVGFYKAENTGLNKGFYVRDSKYLESFGLKIDSSNTVTRLRAFGSNGLTIRGINPIGADYIEDFSFYMYPFEWDEKTEKVIKSSDHLSDSLCIAIKKHQKKIADSKDAYEILVAEINSLQSISTIQSETLSKITLERILLEDERDVLLAEFNPNKAEWGTGIWNDRGTRDHTPVWQDIIDRLAAKRAEESAQQSVLNNANFNVQDKEKEKQNLLDTLAPVENYTTQQWSELQPFIITKEYTNDAITDANDLLAEAQIVFKQMQMPKLTLNISIVDFLSVVECQNDWDKLNLGDTIRVRYDKMNVNIRAKIIEINYDFENFTISLTIANEEELKDDSLIADLLNKADVTSTIVNMDRDSWNLAKENNGTINQIINNKWDSLKNAVLAGYEQQIEISERGIIVKSLEDPESWLVIQNGFLAITNDSGNSWKHAISKDGIFGEYIFGKVISGVNLLIEDESGVWKTQGARTTIYDRTGKETMWLGLVSDNPRDQFDNILPAASECFGMVSWNDHTKVEVTTCKGISISRWRNDDWQRVFWANTDGTLYTKHIVAEGIKIVNDNGSLMLDAENNFFNIGLFENIVADGKLTTLEKLQIVVELNTIHADYKATLAHADKYIRSSRDNITDVNGAWSSATNSFPTTQSTIDRFDKSPLINAYTSLMNYISQFIPITNKGIEVGQSLAIDINGSLMEETSEIENRGYFIQVFRDYNDESVRLKQAIEDSVFYSGISMGKYYNNLVMNEFGFIAVRNDGKYRAYLNATNGLALQKWESGAWVSKLFATLGDPMWEDGTLYAEGLVTKNLRIVRANMSDAIVFDWNDGITIYGNNDEEIRLNANEGIAIDVDGDKRFWVGTDGFLYAKKLFVTEDDGVAITDIDGSYISDLTVNSLKTLNKSTSQQDIVHIADNFIRFKTKIGNSEVNKLEFTYEGSGAAAYPVMRLGSPENGLGTFGTGSEVAKIYKDSNRFAIEYDAPTNKLTRFYFNDTDTDDEGQAVYFDSQGGVRFHSDNKFVAKTAINQYMRVVKDQDVRMQFGDDRAIVMDNEKIRLQFDVNNYIEITSAGIKLVGTRIDLN